MMDKRTLRSRKGKSRSARPYDHQNQSIFGKVYSTVKGFLNPTSWLHWIGNSEEQPRSSPDIEEENINSGNDIASQSVSNSSKRLRLRLDGPKFQDGPSIQNSETQTWPEQPSQNLYEPIRIVSPSSSATQNSLLENKEVMAVINGDDHSENSEGSASTSGCSSLVSSHKESNRIAERPFVSLLDVKNSRKRRATSPKSDYNDLNSSRGLWSNSLSPSLKFQRRYPTVSHTNQPNFNLSSFAGPSRLNDSSEKKISSPFYEGKTTFGGASALRRMPASVVPYQVDRSLRNQIRTRDQNSEDNLKQMSSAAERILLTLNKISSPVSDAKRIPNSDTSPVDLTVYLTPPKSRWNSQMTPSVASKGPPIANINTIAKLATLKNYGTSRLRNAPQSGSAVSSAEQKAPHFEILQPSIPETTISQTKGGGKMKNKLNQHHISSKQGLGEHEVVDTAPLKSIPLPITSLPLINFGSKTDKPANSHLTSSGFTFSKPIEHDLSVNNSVPTSTLALHSPYDSFKFAHPIDYDLPINTQAKENPSNATWECSACWVKNPQSRTSCLACETPRDTKESKNSVTSNSSVFSSFETPSNKNHIFTFGNKSLENTTASTPTSISFKFGKSETVTRVSNSDTPLSQVNNVTNKTSSTWECPSCWVRNPMNEKKCIACETSYQNEDVNSEVKNSRSNISTWECPSCWVRNPIKEKKCLACETLQRNTENDAVVSSVANNSFSTWECTSCWVRNPIKEKKCMACETLHPDADVNLATKDSSGFKFSSPLQNSPITFKFGNYVCTAPSTVTTNTFKFGISVTESSTTTTTSSSGFKLDTSNASIFGSPATCVTVSKTSETSTIITQSSATVGFKLSPPTQSTATTGFKMPTTTQTSVSTNFKIPDVTIDSDKLLNENVSNNSEVSKTKSNFSLEAKVSESISEPKNSCVTENKVENAVIKTKESAPEPENNSFVSNQLDESSKEKVADAVITSSSSLVPNPSVTACFGFTTKPIESKDAKENKLPAFKLANEPASLSAFSTPVNLFKFGEKVDTPKNTLSSTSGTTTTTASFSFANSGSSFGTVTASKNNEVIPSASNTQSVSIKTEENKTVTSTTITSVTSSSPFVFGSSVTTTTPSAFSFFPSSAVSTSSSSLTVTTAATVATTSIATTSAFTFGATSTQPGGFTFKGLEKPQTTSTVPSASQSASLNAGIQTQVPSFQAPVFGVSKTEAPPVTFTFGAGTTTSNSSAFSSFQPSQSGNPGFQFGSQLPGSSTIGTSSNFAFSKSEAPNPTSSSASQSTISVFGSSTPNLVFGAKSENSNRIPSVVSQPSAITFGSPSSFAFNKKNDNSDATSQKPLAFGSSTMPSMPVFGNTPAQPSFDGSDKPASGGFNFGTSSTVFQFGAGSNSMDKKRTATASGFSFGSPAASETNANSFPTGFSMNTPPSFNFGAASTPGPFQFAASGAAAVKPASTVNAGARKIKRAVRRVRGKE